MKEFSDNIKKRIIAFKCMSFIATAVSIYDVFIGGGDFSDSMVGGVSLGTIIALGMLAVVQVIRLSRIITDEKQLKMLYNKQHDERLKEIRSKAGMPMIMIMSILMMIAGIVASSFNDVVFYTLFVAGALQLVIGASVKIYFLNKM
jgi:uncharacterized membrane protein